MFRRKGEKFLFASALYIVAYNAKFIIVNFLHFGQILIFKEKPDGD